MTSPAESFLLTCGPHVAARAEHVGIFTATRWELNAVRRAFAVEEEHSLHGMRCVIGRRGSCRLYLFQTGIGQHAVSTAVQRATAHHHFDLLVSTGFACALASGAVGDLLIGTEVVLYEAHGHYPEGGVYSSDTEVIALATQVAQTTGLGIHVGRVVTVPRVLFRAADKRAVAKQTGAIGADMESAVIYAEGKLHGVPLLVARAVSDVLEEDLPLDFNQFVGRGGWLRGAAHCVMHPVSLKGLNRMRRQAMIGADRLTSFFVRFFDELH